MGIRNLMFEKMREEPFYFLPLSLELPYVPYLERQAN